MLQQLFWQRNGRFLRSTVLIIIMSLTLLALTFTAFGQDTEPTSNGPTSTSSNTYGNYLPDEMGYQGQLVDDNGNPQVGSYTMEFAIYTDPPTYTLRYTETQTVSTDQDGLFNVMIGAVQPGLGTALADGNAWLEVKLDNEILAPRQPMGSVAYALYAQHLIGGTGEYSVIGGGLNNAASGYFSTVNGGLHNHADGQYTTIAGGTNNATVDSSSNNVGNYSTIGGGATNLAAFSYATIAGGVGNSAENTGASIGGGADSDAYGEFSTIAGGRNNLTLGDYSNVAGGRNNSSTGFNATVSGGLDNTASYSYTTVSGGYTNLASDFYAVVGGGWDNTASGFGAVVAGGRFNEANEAGTSVGGGYQNIASFWGATVAGGRVNTASGQDSTIPGGSDNVAQGHLSFAAGYRAKANHNGAFVWSDWTEADFSSTGDKQFLIRANGGVGINTNDPQSQFHVADTLNGNAINLDAHVATIENESTNTGPDILALVNGATNPGGSANYITFFDGSGAIAAIEGNGAGGVAYVTSGADFAEYLPKQSVAEELQPGDVVGLLAEGVGRQTAVSQRVLVVSSAAGFVGNASEAENRDDMVLVAFMGQVPVRVRGPVQAGDLLVASGLNDGTAVVVAQLSPTLANQIVGQALESSEGKGESLVNTLVGLPTDAFWADRLATTETQYHNLAAELAEVKAQLNELETAVSRLNQ